MHYIFHLTKIYNILKKKKKKRKTFLSPNKCVIGGSLCLYIRRLTIHIIPYSIVYTVYPTPYTLFLAILIRYGRITNIPYSDMIKNRNFFSSFFLQIVSSRIYHVHRQRREFDANRSVYCNFMCQMQDNEWHNLIYTAHNTQYVHTLHMYTFFSCVPH